MTKNAHVVRVGDRVRVIKPHMFVRCGYELTPDIGAELVLQTHNDDIVEFLRKIHLLHPAQQKTGLDNIALELTMKHYGIRQLCNALGYLYVKANNFGGSARKIFTQERGAMVGAVGVVVNTRMVVTGSYYPPSGSYENYECGGLMNQTHHRILQLDISPLDDGGGSSYMAEMRPHGDSDIWIESDNVERVI